MNKSEFLNKMSVRWVIALKEEAKVIIDYYEMALINKKTLYPIFNVTFILINALLCSDIHHHKQLHIIK